MLKKVGYFVLVSLLCLAVFFRFYKLGSVPQGLNIDEASYGYEALSLMKTGKDTWGKSWPLTLQSFGDNKPSGLSYAAIPFVKYLGLNSLSVRLPSAIADIITISILYFTLELLFPNALVNLFLIFIYTLSPWPYGISRLFYETNIALTFLSIGILILLRSFKYTKKQYISVAFALIALSGYFYAVFRYVGIAIVGIYLFISNDYDLSFQNIRKYAKQMGIYFLIMIPILISMFSSVGLKRLSQESQSRDLGHNIQINENRNMCYLSAFGNHLFSRPCYVFWNLPLENIQNTIKTAYSLVSPEYLFFSGTQKDILPSDQGAYFAWLFPLYIFGLIYIFKKLIERRKIYLFIALTFIVSLIPTSIAQITLIHRNVIGLYLTFLIIGIGSHYFIEIIRKKYSHLLIPIVVSLFGLGVFTVVKYQFQYHLIYTNSQPEVFNYDAKVIYDYVIANREHYDLIIDRAYVDGPLYYAFYSSLDPDYYQKNVIKLPANKNGWIHNASLANIQNNGPTVSELLCERFRGGGKYLKTLVISEAQLPSFSNFALLHTKSFNQENILHEIYDIEDLFNKLKVSDSFDFKTYCQDYL